MKRRYNEDVRTSNGIRKIVNNSDSIRGFFRDQMFEAIPAIYKKNKWPNSKAIFCYIARNSATNVDGSFIFEMLN